MALERRLISRISRLNRAFALIEPGDRVMVACSGGKDSWAMLYLLRRYAERLPFDISLVAMNLDQGQPGFAATAMKDQFEAAGFEYRMEFADTYSVVLEQTPEGKTYCSRCSRMRRAILHRVAGQLGANKIALGHHRDDAIETLMLNMMYAGRLRAMPPKLAAERDGAAVIRPLLWCAEDDLGAYAAECGTPILPCNLCGNQADTQRKRVKALLASLDAEHPQLRQNLIAAAGNVEPDHLLDRDLQARLGKDSSADTAGSPLDDGGGPEVAQTEEHTSQARPRLRVLADPVV